MKSYQYENRKGIQKISWKDFQDCCKNLAEAINKYEVEAVIGIAKGGLFPATLLAIMLRKEFYPVRVSRREGDVVVHEKPQWRIDVPDIVEGKTIVVIDDIADSGETLDLVAKRIKEKKAKSVLTAALAAHTWAKPKPDMVAISSDKLLVFPWDQKVLANNSWVPHPELQAASKKQNL